MRRGSRLPLAMLAMLAVGVPLPAIAQSKGAPEPPSAPAEPKTKEQLEAQQHFSRAKELYAAGSYREAIAELEQARTLDPKAKDLVFNLGIVHEKLGKFDEAIAFFRQYQEMEGVTAAERTKADTIIKRIEGAKREVPITPTATPSSTSTTAPPPTTPQDQPHGRIDAATITAGSIAIVGLGLGATFGILALSNKPGDGSFVTGRDGSFADLQKKTDDAHTQAVVADISLVVGVLAAGVTAYLYFGRTKDPDGSTPPAQGKNSAWLQVPSPAPLRDGAAIVWGGAFQ